MGLLSIPLNQETSGRKGRRIRLAREQERGRESGFSNPDGVFTGTPITVGETCTVQLGVGIGRGRYGMVCLTKTFTLA